MKPDFAGFMAVEESRITRCGCQEQELEWTVRVRQPRTEVGGRIAYPYHRLQSGGWPRIRRLGDRIYRPRRRIRLGANLNGRIIDLFLQEIDGQTDRRRIARISGVWPRAKQRPVSRNGVSGN